MDNLTHKDIEALRDYLDKLEALNRKTPPEKLTPKEWDEAMKAIRETGKIPAKYEGRIAESEITVDGDIINGKYQRFDTPQKRKSYYDVADEARNAEYATLHKKYAKVVTKALLTAQGTDEESVGEIIRNLLQTPEIRRELEAEARKMEIAPLDSMPNGDSLNFLLRVLTGSKNGRKITKSKTTRGEEIVLQRKGDSLRYTRTNKGSSVAVEIAQAEKYVSKTNKTFTKILLFTLQKMTAQHFPLEVGFTLQELVDLGMYSNTSNAGRAVKDFFNQQLQVKLSGTVKKGRKTIHEEGGVLFYHYSLNNGFVKLSVNENFNMEFIANYFTVFPRFAYALSNNAFSLVRYIFFLARQNTQTIKDKGTFTVSLEAVRDNLGLPSPDEVKNRKYKQYIIDPIEKAIEEVENALQTVEEAKEYGFTITPYGTDTSNIKEWLQGYLEIGLRGDFAETFIRIATKAEKDRAHWAKVKQTELAKIAAKEEAKDAKKKG